MNLIEISLKVDERVIMETLTRIGISNTKEKILFPSCYLHSIDEKYYIVHFKELFLLKRENAYNNISEEDILRKNAIIYCLKTWDLIDVDIEKIEPYNKFVFVLPHGEKENWEIKHKFNVNSLQGVGNEI